MTIHYEELTLDKTAEVVARPTSPDITKPVPFWAYRRMGKRTFDLTAVLLFLPFAALIIGGLAACIALLGGAPFYTQERVGRGGTTYRIWKLRTMVQDADRRLEEHLRTDPAAKQEWDHTQKLRNDPRITPIGRFLRASSMDELPQLWNVLRGDMSLIGPRPMMPSQVTLYPGTAYYQLRPGISGSWQVSARNESSFAERAVFDTSYDHKVSLSEDMRIFVATIRVVLRATGH
ncbi:Sugar transferase involved in LPS biosynthesis (colanic, teichoic acid) [Loktanella atrilutea]|uniref:Sugar transferase involved in LPS biosynthesis (Colanic, teichoic acid) n=1 Tax=Loktanella atrilutea TaxID=366533 RepID=A0A1M5EY19_LOKAT|nr:sugar transferase [Loktanella atrilutea]SHF84036.1 Sugar transferase involved in LPS biosynthesis (colanic, teichoic acid) [Loktanella atrilutea]